MDNSVSEKFADVLSENLSILSKALSEENHSLYRCYMRWRMDAREDILRRVPNVVLPTEIASLLFETSPTELSWYEESRRLEGLIYNWINLTQRFCEREVSETDSETDWVSDSDTDIDYNEHTFPEVLYRKA